MTGSLLLSAIIGAGISLLATGFVKTLYDARNRRAQAQRYHETEIWE